MIPVVNEKYQYLFLYSAKAGCTSLRQLYLSVHGDELSDEQKAQLNHYHNLNEILPIDEDTNYSNYFTFIITRNPYSRVVSAFLDQYVYAKNPSVISMLETHGGDVKPRNFLQFLKVLKTISEGDRDSHFQTQSLCPADKPMLTKQNRKYRFFGIKPDDAFVVDYFGDISGFNQHMTRVYKKVFKHDKTKLKFALEQLALIKKKNSSFYGHQDYDDAALLDVDVLDDMVFAPKPQDFFKSAEVVALVDEIYHLDFVNFAYKKGEIPHKTASKEIDVVPKDLDWETYIQLNPDLPRDEIYNERGVVRHYLEFGRFETPYRAYKIEAPESFDWRRYLELHEDLPAAGINSENAAIGHYLSYGVREGREI